MGVAVAGSSYANPQLLQLPPGSNPGVDIKTSGERRRLKRIQALRAKRAAAKLEVNENIEQLS